MNKPADELFKLLYGKIIIERAQSDYITKQDGDTFKQFNIVSWNRDNIEMFASSLDDLTFDISRSDAFKALAEKVKSQGDRIRFNLLPLPVTKAVENVTLNIKDNVIIRMIDYYEIRNDEILTRYDVLVEKVI